MALPVTSWIFTTQVGSRSASVATSAMFSEIAVAGPGKGQRGSAFVQQLDRQHVVLYNTTTHVSTAFILNKLRQLQRQIFTASRLSAQQF